MERKIKRPGKYQFLILLPFAFCYAFFIVLGDWQRSVPYSNAQNMGRLLLWTVISYGVLLLFGFLSENGGVLLKTYLPAGVQKAAAGFCSQGCRRRRWQVWLFFFLVCLLCYLPYYLMYFPTWFNNDAVWQMEQALGLAARSNHHPYFHTLIIKAFLTAGYGLFGSYTGAVAFYTFFQMTLTAAAFGFYLYLLYCRGTAFFWLVLAAFFYALLPVNGMYSICMGKDAWFTAAFLLFLWAVWRCTSGREGGRRRWLLFFLTGLAVCLLRSNGIFIFLGTAFCMVLARLLVGRRTFGSGEKKGRSMYLSVAAVLACFLLWQGPVLDGLHVEPPDTIEGLTMPTQHLLCAYVRGGSLTKEEVGMLEAVVPLAQIDDYYNPYLFDITKNYIRENGNQQAIADNKWEYAKLWLRVGLRNPMLYLEGEVRQTAGYWAYRVPHYQYLYSEYFMVDNPFGIVNERKVFTYDDSLAMGEYLMKFQDLFNKVWSLGLNTWVMLFGLVYLAWQKKSALCYVPFIMLLLSLLLATPVYNEFRYAYGLFAAFPLLFGFTFGSGDEERTAQKRDGDEDEKMG